MTAGIGGLAPEDQQSSGATGGMIIFPARARGTATRPRKTGPAPGLYFLLVTQPGSEGMRHCERCVHDRVASTPAIRSIPESHRLQNRVDRNPSASHQGESVPITAGSCQWSDNVCPHGGDARQYGESALTPAGAGRHASAAVICCFPARELSPGMWCIPRPGPTGGARHRCPATATSTARRQRCRPHVR